VWLLTPQWHQGAEETGAVLFGALSDVVVLVYNYRAAGGDWEPVVMHIPVERTPCHFGGSRPWFRCPQCDTRVSVLYDAGNTPANSRATSTALSRNSTASAGGWGTA